MLTSDVHGTCTPAISSQPCSHKQLHVQSRPLHISARRLPEHGRSSCPTSASRGSGMPDCTASTSTPNSTYRTALHLPAGSYPRQVTFLPDAEEPNKSSKQQAHTSWHAWPWGSSREPLGGSPRPDPRLPGGLELWLPRRGRSACLWRAHHWGTLHLHASTVMRIGGHFHLHRWQLALLSSVGKTCLRHAAEKDEPDHRQAALMCVCHQELAVLGVMCAFLSCCCWQPARTLTILCASEAATVAKARLQHQLERT